MPRVKTSVERARSIAWNALQHGDPITVERLGPLSLHWDVSHKCLDPVGLEIVGLPDRMPDPNIKRGWDPKDPSWKTPFVVDMAVRCRRCSNCLKVRASLWRHRAETEMFSSERTWFATLTLAPHNQHRCLALARQRADRNGIDFETLSASEQFRARVREASRHLTLFLKRVRKNSGARFRYLLVAEAHKSGAPHFHALIHERAGEPISWAVLTAAWDQGFSKFKLAKDGSGPFDQSDRKFARYVCKYLAKSALARVRASVRYGETVTPLGHSESVKHDAHGTRLRDANGVSPGLEKPG